MSQGKISLFHQRMLQESKNKSAPPPFSPRLMPRSSPRKSGGKLLDRGDAPGSPLETHSESATFDSNGFVFPEFAQVLPWLYYFLPWLYYHHGSTSMVVWLKS